MASRINTRFAILVAAILLVVLIAGYVVAKSWRSPETYIAKAEAKLAIGEFEPAAAYLQKAFGKETDPVKRIEILKRLAATYEQTPPKNMTAARELTGKIQNCYANALLLDEANLWASEKQLDYQFELVKIYPHINTWEALYKRSNQVLDFVSDHPKATLYRAISGTERVARRSLGEADVKQAREDLDRAMGLFPDDGRLAYYSAMWRLNESKKARALNDRKRADQLQDQSFAEIDQYIETRPDDVQARVGRLRLDISAGAELGNEQWRAGAMEQLAAIESLLLKSNDPLVVREVERYFDILDREQLTLDDGTTTLSGLHRGATLLKDACEKNPEKISLQLALGENYWRQAQPDKAIEVFGQAMRDRPISISIEATHAISLRATAMRRLADMHFLKWAAAEGEQDKAEHKKVIEELIAKLDELAESSGVDPTIAELLRGKFAVHNGQYALAKSHLLKADKSVSTEVSGEAQLLLYRVHRLAGETGAAREYLVKAMASLPQRAGQYKLQLDLVRMLIESNQFDSALDRIRKLETHFPNDKPLLLLKARAVVNRTTIAGQISGEQDKAAQKALEILEPLNDKNDKEVVSYQMQLLLKLGRDAEALALVEKCHAEHPDDLDVLTRLIQLHRRMDQEDKADALLAEALAKHPDEPRLKLLNVTDTESLLELGEDVITAQDADEVRRQLKLYNYYKQLGQEEKSKQAMRRAIELDPNDPGVLGLRFEQALNDKQWAEAEKVLTQAKAVHDGRGIDYAGCESWRGQMLFVQGKYTEAESVLDAVQDQLPKDSRVALLLGRTRLALGNLSGAERAVQFSLSMRPNNVDAWLQLHEIHDRLQRHDQALLDLRSALAHMPQNKVLYNRYLAYMGRHGDVNTAVKLRQKQAAVAPKDIENLMALGQLYLNQGQIDTARQLFESILNDDPGQFNAEIGMATVLRAQGRTEEGAQRLRRFLAAHSDNPNVLHWMSYGRYLAMTGDPDGAEAAYRKAIEISGDTSSAASQELAGFYFTQKRYAESAAQYERILKGLGPDADVSLRQAARSSLARSLSLAGQLDRADAMVERMLAEQPDNVDALLLQVAFAYKRLQDETLSENAKAPIRTKLERTLDRAVDLAQANPLPYIQRARYYFNREDNIVMAEVRDDLERARSLDPSSIDARELMARWHLKRDDIDSTLRELRGLISVRPNYRPARVSLVRLCLQHSRMNEAERVLNDSITQFPNEAMWYELRGRKSQMTNENAAAERDFAKAYELQRNVARFVHYGRALMVNGKHDAFLTELRNYPDELAQSALLQAMRANALASTGKTPEALKAFELALSLAGQQVNQINAVLVELNASTDAGQRLRVLEPFIAKDTTGRIELSAVQCYMALDQYDKALEKLKAFESRFEAGSVNLLQTQQLLAKAMYDQGRYEESRRYYEVVIEAQPQNLMALNNIAYILADELNNPEEALIHAQNAEKQTSQVSDLGQRANVLDTLGYVQYRLAKFSEAETSLRRSIALVPLPANRLHLAKVLIAQGRDLRAKEQLIKARELFDEKTEKKVKAEIEKLLRDLDETPATTER